MAIIDKNSLKLCSECGSKNITENPLKFGILPERWLCIDCGFSWSRSRDLQEILSTFEEQYNEKIKEVQ